ncbi:TlpA family protein disulfide reductase [Muricoccus radiodurans]|uniref:TlpA family protein disulfide reductase n=1 Tax=Muricoccus radiodurans TaxID=2231721 RepID=UPI003CEA1AEC
MRERRGVLAGLVGGTLGGALLPRPARAQVGTLREDGPKPLPDLVFTDGEGKETRLTDFAGRGVVLNLWATWCPPCVAEMPALDRLAGVLEADGIAVVALSSDRGGGAQVESFYARTGVKKLGIWLDPRGVATRALGPRGLPTTVLIDRAGRERARLEGDAAWDGPALLADVRRLCGDGPAAPSTEPT